MITAFPKIFPIGQDYISKLFDGPVEITEKVDGSQFVFGKIDGELQMRSKGTIIHDYHDRSPNDLFYPVIQHVLKIQSELPDDMIFYGETLKSPKHNTLRYGKVPHNHFALFAIGRPDQTFTSDWSVLRHFASSRLDTDVVPLLYKGEIRHADDLLEFLKRKSYLGETDIEGIVVKNYHQPFLLGGQPIPIMAGKYVSEAFKEVHRKNWSKENTGVGKWQAFKNGYRTEARWAKAVQHLREAGQLENSPRDIGKLILEVKNDITTEEKEVIKDFLWREFGQDVLRTATQGLPEWYKQQLLLGAFDDDNDSGESIGTGC